MTIGSAPMTSARVTAARARTPRLFLSRRQEPRSRRATDVLLLIGAGGGLGLLAALAVPQPGIERAFMSFVASLRSGLDGLWRLLAWLLALLALVLVLAAAVRQRWAVLRDLALAATLTYLAALVVGWVVLGSWPATWDALRSTESSWYFPPVGLAVACAVVITASPHLTRPARRLGRWVVVLGMFGTVLLDVATPTGTLAGLLVAAAGAAAMHLIFGSSVGRPSLDEVAASLAGSASSRIRSGRPSGRRPGCSSSTHVTSRTGRC